MACRSDSTEISQGDLVRALSDPATYGEEGAGGVEVRETHMSWVFLTRVHAYKLKKPVRFPFLDLSTPELREKHCRNELLLNRRLAEWVYLDVLPVIADAGRIRIGGPGTARDWLVKMRRLDERQMLDAALAQGPPAAERIRGVACHLARFLRDAPPVRRSLEEHLGILARELALDLMAFARADVPLEDPLIERVMTRLLHFLEEGRELLAARLAAGRIKDAHGDLRPEHVYLGSPPAIIDCLEFSRELRIRDCADEVAFLALECERMGAPGTGELFLQFYEDTAVDRPGPVLYAFYRAYRAAQRARLAVWHMADPGECSVAHWLARARVYLDLADRYSAMLSEGPC